MLVNWFTICLVAILLIVTHGSERKCPVECTCGLDEEKRFQTVCTKGGLSHFPFENIDKDVQVIIIQGPRNSVTIGQFLRNFLKLEEMRITDSNVPVIGPESLWGLQHLKILDFSRNNISLVQQSHFRGQNNLLELDLSKNKIITMASSVFCNLTELRRLNLADNSIGELVQRIFFMLSKLKYLDLSGNPLQELPPDVFRDVPQLKVFKCRNCQLKKINPQLYNLLPQLTELDLGRNEFKFLDKDEFRDIKHLRKLQLDGNQLSVVVDELFRSQKNLQHLDLSYNRLAKVPSDSFLSLTNLTFLDLSYNKLVRLEPQSVRRLSHLQTLNISGNVHMNLHEIRETFDLLPHLTHLSIADMNILPVGLLNPFKHLRYLNISGNHLDVMSLQVIEPCQELEFLDLSRNQLHGINEELVLRIKAIRNVRLDNNPLICDECHMGKLIDVVRQLQWKWETYPICFLPKTLRGAEITDLDANGLDSCLEYITDEEQNAASTSHNFLEAGGLNTLAILGGVIFVLIAIIIISVAICFSRNRARYYTREDHLNGSEDKCLEKNLETTTTSITAHSNGSATASPTNGTMKKTPLNANGNGYESMASEPLNPSKSTNDNVEAQANEINFKFPIDDRVCTIDELIVVPSTAPQLPSTKPPPQTMMMMSSATGGNSSNPSGVAMSALESSSCSNLNLRYLATPLNCGSTTAQAAVAAAATVIPPGAPSAGGTTTMLGTPLTPAHHQLSSGSSSSSSKTMPPEAIVVVLPPPTATIISSEQLPQQQHQRQQPQQQQQQLLHLTTLEPLVSVN
ncbi:leucine-rich repeat-containing protein 15 [Musca domestica]|uniref:Leucine-rich repeat-containing protein 15 n=1 Tax=Musca domestica TaxID=7370 RepID=A0A1I8MYU9_MUSDO|nr:leucine-rich repeat-containing protein 15 [Musca domestica]